MRQRILVAVGAVVAMLGLGFASAKGSPANPDRIAGLSVDGTALRVHMRSGRVLEKAELVGATMTLRMASDEEPARVFIAAQQIDAHDPQREITLYHMLTVDPDTGAREELCGPDANGEHWAFPVAGQWDSEGRHLTDSGYTLTCADGAQGKCVRWGYKPWKTLPNGESLAPYHQACIHLVRASYCGDEASTNTGMLIDIYDKVGIQNPEPEPAKFALRFEAAWNAQGAVCVAHTRVPDNMQMTSLPQSCPRLRERLGVASCTESTAGNWGDPVLLFNRSR